MDVVEASPVRRKRSFLVPILVVGLIAILGAAAYPRVSKQFMADASNYKLGWEPPTGWNKMPTQPLVLFLYQDPATKATIRGSVNAVESDLVATPELDTDGMAEQLIDVTKTNLDGWKVAAMPDMKGKDHRFRVVRRERPGRTIITAITVKGNTTILISLAANSNKPEDTNRHLDKFEDFLATTTLDRIARL